MKIINRISDVEFNFFFFDKYSVGAELKRRIKDGFSPYPWWAKKWMKLI